MKEKITSIIMFFVSLGICAVIILFVMIIFEEAGDVMQIGLKDTLEVSEENVNKIDNSGTNENNVEVNNTHKNTVQNNIEAPQVIQNPLESMQNSDPEEEKVEYNINVEGYFYNQLNKYSKTIYKAFVANKERMKTGTAQIDLGNTFSSLLDKENGQELLGDYYQSAIEAYTYDNADVFYLSPNKMYLNIETTTRGSNKTYRVFINNGNQSSYLIDEFSSKEQVDLALSQINKVRDSLVAKKTGNRFQDIKMVHDYLVDNLNYDSTLTRPNIYNIYGALVDKICVCEGYAKSFKYILDAMDIPCTLVIGKGVNSEGKTENHAWNYVELNGVWYAVDTTWDDPIILGGGILNKEVKYRYFLKGANTMNKDHMPSGQFTQNGKVFTYPELGSSDYKY